ncbi:MAG: VWA domain-containing protein [Pseudomonadota bacterium]
MGIGGIMGTKKNEILQLGGWSRGWVTRSWVRSVVLGAVTTVLVACGGGSDSDSDPVPPPAANRVSVSGTVADGAIGGSTVSILSMDGAVLGTATASASGVFTIEVVESRIDDGYRVRAAGGQFNGGTFSSSLESLYGSNEARAASNVSVLTSLVTAVAERAQGTALLTRRDAAIQTLTGIGLFSGSAWRDTAPAEVNSVALRRDAAAFGVSALVADIADDTLDGELDPLNMVYFPVANGGITRLLLSSPDFVVTAFPGTLATESVLVLGASSESVFEYSLLSGPSGLTIDEQGSLSYAAASAPADGAFEVEVLNSETGTGRRLLGRVDVPTTQAFALGEATTSGATLRDVDNAVEVVIPQNGVDQPTSFVLRRAVTDSGVALEVQPSGNVNAFEIYLPSAESFSAGSSDPERASKSARSEARGVPDNLWQEQRGWFYRGDYRMGEEFVVVERQATLFSETRTFQAESRVASTLSCSEPIDSTGLVGKVPVLFIHGYTAFNNLGGGVDTWGDFPARISELTSDTNGYLACEFRWITNARFEAVAEDLRKAIETLVQKTERETQIVAHSFGGILARTYLQGLADSPIDNYRTPVASLTTLGTPHSGIAQDDGELLFGQSFPDGQDSEFAINLLGQISGYQMGETVNFGFGNVIGNDITRRALMLNESKGYVAAAISDVSTEDGSLGVSSFPAAFPVQVLIGLHAEPSENEGAPADEYIVQSGDGLISYAGQRFHPRLTADSAFSPLLSPNASSDDAINRLRARVTEHVLGTSSDVRPGNQIDPFDPDLGFAHNGLSGGTAGRFNQVELACASLGESSAQTGCDVHDGFRRVREWLAANESDTVDPAFSDFGDLATTSIDVSIIDIESSDGASNARILATVVNQDGTPLNLLMAGNFAVQESIDGSSSVVDINAVSLEAVTRNAVVIAIDRSGSMGPAFNNDIIAAKAAASSFVSNMRPSDQAAIIDFAGDVFVRQDFTRDQAVLQDAIDEVDVIIFNGTAAYDAAFRIPLW